jgi:hypothetical protein
MAIQFVPSKAYASGNISSIKKGVHHYSWLYFSPIGFKRDAIQKEIYDPGGETYNRQAFQQKGP